MYFFVKLPSKELKPLQNKKGQKNLRYPTKKQPFAKKKDCFFVGYLKLFWPFLFWNGFRPFAKKSGLIFCNLMYSNLNSVSTFNSRETVEVVHTYISSFTLRSTITGKVEFELSKLPRLPFIGSNDNSNGRIFEQYILLEKIVFCCILAWIHPEISGCQQYFLIVWRWNQLRTC